MKKSQEEIKIQNETQQILGLLRRMETSINYLRVTGVDTSVLERRVKTFKDELSYYTRIAVSNINSRT